MDMIAMTAMTTVMENLAKVMIHIKVTIMVDMMIHIKKITVDMIAMTMVMDILAKVTIHIKKIMVDMKAMTTVMIHIKVTIMKKRNKIH